VKGLLKAIYNFISTRTFPALVSWQYGIYRDYRRLWKEVFDNLIPDLCTFGEWVCRWMAIPVQSALLIYSLPDFWTANVNMLIEFVSIYNFWVALTMNKRNLLDLLRVRRTPTELYKYTCTVWTILSTKIKNKCVKMFEESFRYC